MNILFVGKYNPEYNRNKIILEGLRKLNDLTVCELPFNKKKDFNLTEFNKLQTECDFIYCPSFSHKFVKFITKKASKPVIFDPLISNYLTKVYDYKSVSKWSPRAYKNYLKDKLPFKAVDLLIADTEEHKKYYHTTFNIELDKIKVLPVGASVSDFNPTTKTKTEKFVVGFYGGFIPLQGVKYIIETAELLKNDSSIEFRLLGTGFQYEEMQQLAKHKQLTNLKFEGWINYADLPQHINNFDICLGIFGDTPKAQFVIPNKIFHYAAMGKPIITMESDGIKEIFKHEENIFLTTNNKLAIKNAILKLKDSPELAQKLSVNTLNLLRSEYSETKIAEKLVAILKKYNAQKKGE